MAVRIRINRVGRRNSPFYRVGVYDSRSPRNGKCLENLGTYDAHEAEDKKVNLNVERLKYWMSVGALPTPKAAALIKKAKISVGEKK